MPAVTRDYVPKYRLHKHSGQAIVTLSGKDHLLGVFNSPASTSRYHELIAQWIAGGRKPLHKALPTSPTFAAASLTIAGLVELHEAYARSYYLDAAGQTTTEVRNFAAATLPMREMFGSLAADQFTPSKLRLVREQMITRGWARTLINKHVNRIRSIWKWAVSHEHLKPEIHLALAAVEPLKYGRSNARESTPVAPVPYAHVEAIEDFVSPAVWALIQLQRFTGARGGELFRLRAIDIDTTGTAWTYRPARHKTAHFGHKRTIYFGPKAQAVLSEFISGRPVDAFLFSPLESNAARKAKLATKGQHRRPNQKPNRRKSLSRIRDTYDSESYRRAIARGCELASRHAIARGCENDVVPAWHPHQLRHAAATLWRKSYGPDGALLMLGDKTTRMVDVYAEKDHQAAMKIASEIG